MHRFPNIEAERGRSGMSQAALAALLKVSLSTLKNWMTGKTNIPSSALLEMANLWGVTIDYLLGQTNNPTKSA